MGSFTYTVPVAGSDLNSIADPQIATALSTILTWGNGNVDSANISALFSQSAGVNTGSQTVKGAVNIAGSQSTGSTTYTTLGTPDQVAGIVLPANGLIRVWYQATWQESVAGAARAAIFIGSNQLKIASPGLFSPVTQAALTASGSTTATSYVLSTFEGGLVSYNNATGYVADVTTGQVLGIGTGTAALVQELNLAQVSAGTVTQGGPCDIQGLPAGTYTISVQFKASSGTVTALNRKLWVQALSFT
jgi:hypothetical protein